VPPSGGNVLLLALGVPRAARALFDVLPDQSTDDLRRGEILRGTQVLEHGLLAGIDEDRQSRGSFLGGCDPAVLHGGVLSGEQRSKVHSMPIGL
jgi:hypothetical protein